MSDSVKANHVLGARKRPVYCFDFETGKFCMEFPGLRPMARSLNLNNANYIKYYLDKHKVFNCTIDNINYKFLLKSSKVSNPLPPFPCGSGRKLKEGIVKAGPQGIINAIWPIKI